MLAKIQPFGAPAEMDHTQIRSMMRSVNSMYASFKSLAVGFTLSVQLLCLILAAQFRSFLDPFISLLALPSCITGVPITLFFRTECHSLSDAGRSEQ